MSESKRTQIKSIATELGYVPNFNARSLVSDNSGLIGISFPTLFNDVFAEVLEGFQSTVDTVGLTTVVNTSYYDPKKERKWIEHLLSWCPAGLVLTGVDHALGLAEMVKSSGVPCVETWDITNTPIDSCVGIDHTLAGWKLAEFATSLEYCRPGIVRLPVGYDPRLDKRMEGISSYFATLTPTHKPTVSVQDDKNSFRQGYLGTQDLMSNPQKPDVVFYVNDHVAFGGLAACRDAGISVPDQIGIIGFNGLDISEATSQKLTTAFSPRRQIGVQAARNLISRLNGVAPRSLTKLPVRISPGGTTRQPS